MLVLGKGQNLSDPGEAWKRGSQFFFLKVRGVKLFLLDSKGGSIFFACVHAARPSRVPNKKWFLPPIKKWPKCNPPLYKTFKPPYSKWINPYTPWITPPPDKMNYPHNQRIGIFETPLYKKWHFWDSLIQKTCRFPTVKITFRPPPGHLNCDLSLKYTIY